VRELSDFYRANAHRQNHGGELQVVARNRLLQLPPGLSAVAVPDSLFYYIRENKKEIHIVTVYFSLLPHSIIKPAVVVHNNV